MRILFEQQFAEHFQQADMLVTGLLPDSSSIWIASLIFP
jgi:hypothetical protein